MFLTFNHICPNTIDRDYGSTDQDYGLTDWDAFLQILIQPNNSLSRLSDQGFRINLHSI